MLEIFRRQELMDREMAPVIGRCPCCGGEIYDEAELEVYDGLCRACRMETAETDNDMVFWMEEVRQDG